MDKTVSLRQGNPLVQQTKPSLGFFIIPSTDLQEKQRTGILLQFPDASVAPFQLLRDGEQKGHLFLERGSAHFTPYYSLHGVQWLGLILQPLHTLIDLFLQCLYSQQGKIYTSYRQFSWSVMETCFHSWKFGFDARLPSVSIFCFAPQARCSLSYPGLLPPLIQVTPQSFFRCCACISCHLPTLGRSRLDTVGGSGSHRCDFLGLRSSFPCKWQGNITLWALPVFGQDRKVHLQRYSDAKWKDCSLK